MLISSQTKIAALLKHHPDALEAIVSLSPDFKKLRNPILRKLMAGRTSIAMASKIGGCRPEDFFEKLKPYGFEAENAPEAGDELPEYPPLPQFLRTLPTEQTVDLDVRAMLAGGTDPLKHIQQTVRQLARGQVLKIVNTFEPTPLIRLLEKQGFQSYTDFVGKDWVETYFCKAEGRAELPRDEVLSTVDDWNEVMQVYDGKLQEIDVRHLQMPEPMMSILAAMEQLPSGKALFVYHKRIPVYLLSEIKDRDFDFRIKEVADGEVHLLIFKN